ncbi:Serine/threonine-protein kinase TOR [Mycena chlorophos]|uniref:Serine/threonine-protein kinase TOR n=1 Tax=Mycena chlorophos TaxID=658473 RepID=A0A8H6T2Z3_MYCCL|nr:Serine/threonine-protein kinase TOR [Mycena chlorophos]
MGDHVEHHSDSLPAILEGLESTNPDEQTKYAVELRNHVLSAVNESSPDVAGAVWDAVNQGLFTLTHSQHTEKKLGGLLAMSLLLEIDGEETVDSKRNLYRFYNYVKHLLPDPDVKLMLVASQTLGKIVNAASKATTTQTQTTGGGAFNESFMDHQVPAAINLIQQPDTSRYAGVLILKELALNSPQLFYAHIGLVFKNILIPLRDQRLIVREAAADLLGACLEIVSARERPSSGYLKQVLEDAEDGCLLVHPEVIHASLLAYRALFLHGGMFMRDVFSVATEKILQFRTHRDPLIRKLVLSLLPPLAAYDTQTFCDRYLKKTMMHLIDALEKPTDRTIAFTAIGMTARIVKSDMKPYLQVTVERIKQGLQPPRRKSSEADQSIFECVSMLSEAVGPALTRWLPDVLELMFKCGLSTLLKDALIEISSHIPTFLKEIQDRLLDLLSVILSGKHYKPVGAPLPARKESITPVQPLTEVPIVRDPEQIKLALNILGTFDFSGHVLSEFVRSCALPYVEEDHAEVRREAAVTCCRLFVRDPIFYSSSSHAIQVISDVLNKLLTVAIADPEPSIRKVVLSSLHSGFDKHLAQAENIRCLFIALNDEVYDNRRAAVNLIGRMAKNNPAYVVPSLRKTLIQLLTELEYATAKRNREECTSLLTMLVNVTHNFMKPYALPMLAALMPKANDTNPTVAANIIMCLGELTVVAGEEALSYIPDLMTTIISYLSDPSLVKRDAALHTLGQVCTSTGYVIDPFIDYPELLQLLTRILRAETTPGIVQREVLKVVGIVGALDPYTRQVCVLLCPFKCADDMKNRSSDNASETPVTVVNVVTEDETKFPNDFFQETVIDAIIHLLADPSLHTHHHTAIEALMSIFKTLGLKLVMFLPRIIPAFAAVTRSSPARLQEFHLQQLGILITIIKQHVRNYTMMVFSLVPELWDIPTLQLPLVSLVEALANALAADFKPLLTTVIPLFVRGFEIETGPKRVQTLTKMLEAFQALGPILEEYLYLVIPVIVKTYERVDAPTVLRRHAIHTIDRLTRHVNFSDHSSRIVHSLIRVFNTASNELRGAVVDTLCSLVIQLGPDFAVFVPMINSSLRRSHLSYPRYESLIAKLLRGERLQEDNILEVILKDNTRLPEFSFAETSTLVVNQTQLRYACDTSRLVTASDWTEWMRRLRLELMKESPSHALRACMSLPAFVSCWVELTKMNQDIFVQAFQDALESPTAPMEIIHSILDLVEFVERQEKTGLFDNLLMGDYTMRHGAYAKALHYKEQNFFAGHSTDLLENLISINTRLQLHDAANGLVHVAGSKYDIQQNEEWYEKLGQWASALDSYKRKAEEQPGWMEWEMGRMKCLHALGEWDELSTHVGRCWEAATAEHKITISPMAATAAWSNGDWDSMELYIGAMKPESPDRHFFKAIMSIHQNNFPRAWQHIAKTRELLHPQLVSFEGDAYGRSYNVMVRAQLLSELEEVINYKKSADSPAVQAAMRRTWMKRHRILQVRTLVINPESEPDMWIKFANLCRSADRMALAEKTIQSLRPVKAGQPYAMAAPPAVVYAQLKLMWVAGPKDEAMNALQGFTTDLLNDLKAEDKATDTDPRIVVAKQPRITTVSKLLARCYYKLGEWQAQLRPDWVSNQHYDDILSSYRLATHYDGQWYKAWHTWALANFDVISKVKGQDIVDDLPAKDLAAHAVQAIHGFFRSISLRNSLALQDTLRLLTLWFEFGSHSDVSLAINKGFSEVGIETWLEVIPQIIARIQTPYMHIRRDIHQVLSAVGQHHPQALIYPLVVASQSSSKSRQLAANELLGAMKQHHAKLVDQAECVSHELIRVAILWNERWHDGLEEASRLYFTEKNADGMIHALAPLHDMLEKGPETARESAFAQTFGRELREARECCRRFRNYGETAQLDKAWDIYYAVFKKIDKQLQSQSPQVSTLDLQHVSPWLLAARDLELAIPGTYRSGHEVVSIQRFAPKLHVITSKQRPRRLYMHGSDGKEYQYLLKGHEDLRQDERVMQLFSLVNTLLSIDTQSFQRRLHIQRYPVIPIAPNAGLLGWVQGNDTLHVLIRDYREARKVVLNIEYRMILQMAPDYENLTLLQKVEVFEYAMQNTTGQDLYRIMWLKSKDSEHWLDRRAMYTRSLAVSSMTGHILGLGDRHPSNLLIERATGKIIQIDFGDCFEIAMHREKFPEKIPFRLTRMLTEAMEASGVEGSFRTASQITMAVLRSNKESLMAVLEAFIYDPLMNWRLAQLSPEGRRTNTDPQRAAELARVAVHPQGPTRKLKANENLIFDDDPTNLAQDGRNSKALSVYNRVQRKLNGRDFDPEIELTVEQQVDRLIQQATAIENLCQCFSGWCAFW